MIKSDECCTEVVMKNYVSPIIVVLDAEVVDCFRVSDGPDSPYVDFEWE